MGDERDPGMETSRPPRHRQGAFWTERSLLALIIASLAVTFNLLLAVHRQAIVPIGAPDSETKTPQITPPTSSPKPVARSQVTAGDSGGIKPAIAQSRPERPKNQPAPEDPTKMAVAGLTNATGQEIAEAERSDGRAMALETARRASVAESRRWKRRELLVRQQIASLTDRANQLESETESLDAERDVLAHERDALKAALTKAGRRSGFAVLPYKGPNGTWRRPIVLECTAGSVKLQPRGLTFSSMELSPLINPRSSPLVRAVAGELLHVQASDTPDGAPAVPYLVFLVRPSGIRQYYEARTCLEPLGIAFGYELIEQDLVVDIPNFDNLATWDGSVPLDMPLETAPGRRETVAEKSRSVGGDGTSAGSLSGSQANRPSFGAWPERSDGGGHASSGDQGSRDAASPEDFVWPTRARQNAASSRPSSRSDAADSNEGPINREDVGRLAPGDVGSPSGCPPSGRGTGPFGT
ncbi:MAG TPA: bZIP transcription factor, partial [Isosphaeraceae bacterium]|nr:bZIP transcription factor [Isosphaeraceae bacterium]